MLLALDIASETGWAIGSAQRGRVASGFHKIPKTGNNIGLFLSNFAEWLEVMLDQHDLSSVTFESPIMPGVTNIMTLRKLYALTGYCEMACLRRQIRCEELHQQTWRKHFMKATRAPKTVPANKRTKWLKDLCIAECQNRGWDISNDNEADACGLLDCILCRKSPDYAARTSLAAMGGAVS